MKYPLEKSYRLLSPRLVVLVTTVNSKQGVNAAPISFCSPVSFSPPIVMISLTPEIRTHKNIKETKEFVINILPKQYIDQVLRCAARYPEGVNKLEVVGLKKFSSVLVKPPRVKEAFAWLECRLIEEKRLGDHFAIFGEVLTAEIKDEVVKDGEIDFSKVSPVLHLFKEYFAFDFKVAKQKRYD
ncbi:MAG: flavin reductase family protein [Candidatus Aenigmarchaeota archaeon]|nr:flavin reductase family protein [Candidatus Aenigmarchaeota archaeon]